MGNARRRPKRLGEKLREIRDHLDLSLEGMAKILSDGEESLRKTDISKYELDQREPNLMVLLRYGRVIGVPVELLIDDSLEISVPTSADSETYETDSMLQEEPTIAGDPPLWGRRMLENDVLELTEEQEALKPDDETKKSLR